MKESRTRIRRGIRRAFFLVDLVLALTIAGALVLSLSISVGALRSGERRLAETRAVTRQLEEAMLKLQTGGTADPAMQIERLNSVPGGGGGVWVRLSLLSGNAADRVQSRVSLVGLVPADKAPGGAP